MLAVLLAPVVGELVEPFALPPSAVLQLKEQMEKMRAAMGDASPRPARAVNPCLEDMARFKCKDASCLKANAEALAPSCAALLLGTPEPSPAPKGAAEPSPVRTGGEGMSIRMGSGPLVVRLGGGRPVVAPETTRPQGFYSITTSGSGGSHTYNGVIGPHGILSSVPRVAPSATVQTVSRPSLAQMAGAIGPMAMPGFSSMLDILPPEFLAILASPGLISQLEVDDDADDAGSGQHPCAREVSACTRETHSASRNDIEGCLIHHFPQLSRECQCFVHHLTNGRPTSQPQPSAAVRAVPVVAVATVRTVPVTPARHAEPPAASAKPPAYHRLSCLLVFTTLFLATFMLVRATVLACCGGRPVRRVVVVPPEQTSIRTVEPHPDLPKLDFVTNARVQVAEPYRKA